MILFIFSNTINIAGCELRTPAVVAAICSVLLLPLLRWAALPKPIPGIPYNKTSASRILGDIPEMKKAERMRFWMRDQFAIHSSPIVQIFITPLGKPWLLVSDFREAQDVLVRRTKEFDKSSLTSDSFSGVVAASHISMKTTDHRFKHNKELVKDLMTPAFLNEVSAPEIHEKIISLLDLWTIKTRDSDGRPFKADMDIHVAALDIIMAVAFDFPQRDTMIVKQVAHLKSHSIADSTGPQDEPFPFSAMPLDPELDPERQACVYLTQSIGVAFQSPLPRIAHWLYLQRPHSRRALQLRKQLIGRNIDKAIKRLENPGTEKKMRCAVDQILLREMASAKKHGIPPDFHKSAIYDELFGYIVGGHDTTSTTLAWWVKFMAQCQRSQSRLRDALYAAHAAAFSEDRLPTASEITRAHVPYLDAMMEETLRYTHIVPTVIRQATVDTQILSHPIPKGTNLFFFSSGAGFMQPAFNIDEEKRSESARHAKDRCGVWDPTDIGKFAPERWLKTERSAEDGETVEREVFNSQAGPQLAFGAGPRGCFGRRLAYLEMRIAVTLLIWSFEFLEMGEKLNNFEAVDFFALLPRDCYVKLKKIQY